MDNTLKDWFTVIKNGSIDNTYKMGWSKSIVECCLEGGNNSIISFDRISKNMFKYYWNQTIFFDLQQSPNPKKPPVLVTYVKEKIKEFQKVNGFKPIKFERVEDEIDLDIKFLNNQLKKDVSYRFLKVDRKEFSLYELDKGKEIIVLPNPEILKEYSDLLFEIINYRWSQILENFNSSPRISQKIKITDRGNIRRKSLSKFHKYLTLSDKKCFICGEDFEGDISIDHVIPWSFMYSDDLWNLVYTHKGCNSSKSNRIVDESEIQRLENRNLELVEVLDSKGISDKHLEELRLSNEKNFPKKFWIGFKG
ncbi:HNH endonuclease [Maribacter sp. ACAM166]|uniref:HNH endonuclease n=1 Tax=Maribacter sp. ACAM166 TaxID=2508996 RepID=UPI0010FD5DD3|nr:HNH endonuclease signature motif containing protein [Maribacter sp. ACAM166]TLP73236.1 HNH endonuclease [Maribacter sp. ACAM166]